MVLPVFAQDPYHEQHSARQGIINTEGTHGSRRVSQGSLENHTQPSQSGKLDTDNENNKSLLTRNITTLNRLIAMSVSTAGSSIAGGVSVFNPVNLAMATTQYATGIALKYCPDNPGVRTTAEYLEKAAHVMGLLSRGPAVISSGSPIPIVLYGVRYLCQKGVDDYIKGLLQYYLPDTPRELAEPWAQALNQIATAYAFKNTEALMLSETGGSTSRICGTKENGQVCFAPGSGYTPGTNHSMGVIASPPEQPDTPFNTGALMTPKSVNGCSQWTDDQVTHPVNGDNAEMLNLLQNGNNTEAVYPIKRYYKLARQHDVRDAPVRLPRYTNTPFSLKNTYPWIVELVIQRADKTESQNNTNIVYSKCSGFFIDNMSILTAAHCVDSFPGALNKTMQNLGNDGNEIYVHFENLDLGLDTTIVIKASKFIVHPKYNTSADTPDDIAIIHTGGFPNLFEEKKINIPIPSILELPITQKNASSIIRLMAGGYSQNSLQTPEMSWELSPLSEEHWRQGYLVLKHPWAQPGDSGGPLFGNGHGINHITGVASAAVKYSFKYPVLGNVSTYTTCLFSPTARPLTLSFLKRHVKGARFIDQLQRPRDTPPTPTPTQAPDSNHTKNTMIKRIIGGTTLIVPLILLGTTAIKACKRYHDNNERLNCQLITNSFGDVFGCSHANPDHQHPHSPSEIVEMTTMTERTEETPKPSESTAFCGP